MSSAVTTSSSASSVKLSTARMLGLNAIVCGLEFCASSAFCYIPPLLLKAGITEQSMTLVLGVGPTLGFFLVPVIGRASDQCRSRLGRRRPFILALSVILLAALFLIPFGDLITTMLLGPDSPIYNSTTVILLIIGAVMLDFSCQASLTPCEALLSDSSRGTSSRERCFTIYSLAVSVGGCVGYLITALDWSANSVGEYFGSQEHSVFMMLAMLYVVSALVTFASVHEVPLSAVDSQSIEEGQLLTSDGKSDVLDASNDSNSRKKSGGQLVAPMSGLTGRVLRALAGRLYSFTPDVIRRLFNVPYILKRLALANFCSWTAVMSFNLFYTDYVGQAVYGGDPHAPADSDLRTLYDTGVRMGSWGLLLHCVASAVYAPVVESLVARFNLRRTYLAGMCTFAVAMTAMTLTRSIYIVNALACCTGFAYATLTTVPFMLITAYHENRELYFFDTGGDGCGGGSIAERGFGTDLATLDSAYFLSQVILTSFMGSIVHYSGTVLSYIVVAVVMGCLSCIFVRRIICDKLEMQVVIRNNNNVV